MPSEETVSPEQGLPGAADQVSAAPAFVGADIVVTNVHKTFGVTRALDGVSFSARCGEIHAIVGGNGCGKSTLAKVISGVLPIDSGQVSILGHAPGSPREARLAGIATVFQEILVADHLTVLDNLFVGADGLWSKSLSLREKHARSEALMRDLSGVDVDPDEPVGGLSLSIKQWITIGRALIQEPRVLILDESSAALDFDSTEKLFEKMRELRDKGTAVLIVTHRIAELIRISDRATVLRDGRDVGVLAKEEVTEQNLLGLMTGRSQSTESEDTLSVLPARDDTVMSVRGLKVWEGSKGIDFDLHRGEVVGVAGLDGQGQDEFVRVLAGVQPALEGVPLVRRGSGRLAELHGLEDADQFRVAYVSGDRKREGIFPNLSIFENLTIALYPKELKTRLGNIIDWSSLASVFENWRQKLSIKIGLASDKVTSLSGGNQQKVLIGRAMALNPRILVLNDPARGIDVEAKRELYDHLRDFAARGESVVFMSSELEEFIGLCTRVIVFRHGEIFDAFAGDDIEPARLLEAMFGQTSGRGARLAAGAASGPSDVHGNPAPESEREVPRRQERPQPGAIRIIDFDAERQGRRGQGSPDTRQLSEKRMKIVYSDG